MKRYQQFIFGLLGLVFTTTSFATQLPIKITSGTQQSTGHVYRTVNITSTVDALTINSVRVNRGQCHDSIGNPVRPYSLPFGKTQTYRYMIYNGMSNTNYNCDIIEIVVKTDQGDWTFNP
ncbi:hypothetical protein [Providencia rettgeri]|uniref:hypothetical protein n=1 Tax=Providencia rettgeri TaxID=587 RepID=UPI0023AAE5AC|nr:hypothetical protein [Providencia rettgeri]